MAISTYSELQGAVADWLNRDDLAAVVPQFITLTEADMNRKIRDWRMEKRSDASLEAQFSVLPSDWLETVRIGLTGSSSRLELVSDGALAEMRAMRRDGVGKPTHYAHTAGSLELFPTPDATYEAELVYVAKITSLSNTNTTNWLLGAAPDAYLYGALMQAAPYLKDDARIAIWGGLYAEAINNLNSSSERARYSGAGLRRRNKGMTA